MSNNQILVPVKVEGKEFYASRTDEALRNCQNENYAALFMPSVADTRIEAPKDTRAWQSWYTTPSIRATGRTKQGTPVVVYAHVPNHFSDPSNITQAIENGLVNGAGILPQPEFQRLLDLKDDKNVFVIDYNSLRGSSSDVIHLKQALEHPQTIPFLGGKERAEKYLERHKEVFGNSIGILHSDDLSDQTLARLLFLGSCYGNILLGGNYNLYDEARFLGVGAEGAQQKFSEQQLESKIQQALTAGKPFEFNGRIYAPISGVKIEY
ncbi:hypothetical protein HYV88_03660 [Candidatus Woesearchaeota archaeon]|nr:hypothetical protein [Candidatus Woesearchaeota archaeon]